MKLKFDPLIPNMIVEGIVALGALYFENYILAATVVVFTLLMSFDIIHD